MPAETPWGQQAHTYHAREDRRMLARVAPAAGVMSGLVPSTGGSGLQVAISAGEALVRGSHAGVTRQGLYPTALPASENVTLAAADGTNPRIDRIYLRVRDTEPAPATAGDAQSDGLLHVVTGTPTAAVTLNAPGASPGAAPASGLLIADVLVPAAFAGPFVTLTHIRDRRPFVLGSSFHQTYTGGDIALGTTPVGVFASRLEISHPAWNGTDKGVVWMSMTGSVASSAGTGFWGFIPMVDGSAGSIDGTATWPTPTTLAQGLVVRQEVANGTQGFGWRVPIVVPLGSHTFGWYVNAVGPTTASLRGTAAFPLAFMAEEDIGTTDAVNGRRSLGA
jgi:hypothetical protein